MTWTPGNSRPLGPGPAPVRFAQESPFVLYPLCALQGTMATEPRRPADLHLRAATGAADH